MPGVPCVARCSATAPLVRMERSTLAPPVGGAMIPPAAKLSRSPPRDVGGGGLMASFTDPDGNVLGLFGAGAGTSHSSVRSAPGAAPSIGSPTTSRQGAISTPGGLPVWATSSSPPRPPRRLRSDPPPDVRGWLFGPSRSARRASQYPTLSARTERVAWRRSARHLTSPEPQRSRCRSRRAPLHFIALRC
jgi:hypothetical protein